MPKIEHDHNPVVVDVIKTDDPKVRRYRTFCSGCEEFEDHLVEDNDD